MNARFGNALFAALVLVAAALAGFLSTRYGVEGDWSHAHAASLSPDSIALKIAGDRQAPEQRAAQEHELHPLGHARGDHQHHRRDAQINAVDPKRGARLWRMAAGGRH